MPTPDRAVQRLAGRRRAAPRRPARRCATTPSAPGSVGSRDLGEDRAVRVDDDARASWSRRCRARRSAVLPSASSVPPCLAQQVGHRGDARAGLAVRADPSAPSRRGRPGQPHSTTTACGRLRERARIVGPPVRVAHLHDQRRAAVRQPAARPGSTTGPAGSPHGTSPTAMLRGRRRRGRPGAAQVGQVALDADRSAARPPAGAASSSVDAWTPGAGRSSRRSARPPPRAAPRSAGRRATAATIACLDLAAPGRAALSGAEAEQVGSRRRATAPPPPGCRGRRTRRPCRGRR